MHVEYENGTHVFVNRGSSGDWTVKDHQGNVVVLPASGWLVFNPLNGFYEVSAKIKGRRLDWVSSSDYEFLDGRGQWTRHGTLEATGSVVRRTKAAGITELIDIYGNDRIAFKVPAPGQLTAYDRENEYLGKVDVTLREGWYEFQPITGGRRYLFAEK